jgi:D-arabinose 1-dehydrogenase-like Zn-dependent alcohol dehydrogenase
MKALVLESYNNLMVKEVPQPVYNEKDLLIRVKACGICGSDVHGWMVVREGENHP